VPAAADNPAVRVPRASTLIDISRSSIDNSLLGKSLA